MGSFKINFDIVIKEGINMAALLLQNHLGEVVHAHTHLCIRNSPEMGEARALLFSMQATLKLN